MSKWSVYLLVSTRGRTYIGATTDPGRRLRQHNKEIRGGARATGKESGWSIVAYITGFRDRQEAYRWEALLKKRARGKKERLDTLLGIAQGVCPEPRKSTGKMYTPPRGLTVGFAVNV